MSRNNSNRSRAAWARGFVALCAALAMGLGLLASRAEAAPFGYVTNSGSNTVSVIDTPTNNVVATLAVGISPAGVAVAPDGKHAYVTNFKDGTVSVIDAATNTVEAATLAVGTKPFGLAVTPDGAHVYVTNAGSNNVSVIDTATNTVEAATLPVGSFPVAVAVTPDGKHAYVTNEHSNNVSVIDTATNTVEAATLAVGTNPAAVAVTPDGKHAYVANGNAKTVSVIDTATNMVVATLAVGTAPNAVAVSPDGKHAYVTNGGDNNVSVIDTATNTVEAATLAVGTTPVWVAVTPDGKNVCVVNIASNNVSVIATASNTVVATVPVGNAPQELGIVPPPPGVPFIEFGASLNIGFGTAPNQDGFSLGTGFALSSTAPVINPLTDQVTLQIGTFAVTIPPGSFKKNTIGGFNFTGLINGVILQALIMPAGTLIYQFQAKGALASFTGTQNPVYVTLAIGGGSYSNSNSGATSVTAAIFH